MSVCNHNDTLFVCSLKHFLTMAGMYTERKNCCFSNDIEMQHLRDWLLSITNLALCCHSRA